MYNKTQCFIYLFSKLKLPFNNQSLHASLQQLSGHADGQDIV